MNPIQLAEAARNMSGNPRQGGQFLNADGKPIRFEGKGNFGSKRGTQVVQAIGGAAEFGRDAIPWFNITMQSTKRMADAYLQNPAAFTGRLWLYTMMPAAAGYLYNRAGGPEYTEYMKKRSAYAQVMYQYVRNPGRPPEEGFEIPRTHILAGASNMMETALDHWFGTQGVFESNEEAQMAAETWLGTAFGLPLPPAATIPMAATGFSIPQGGIVGAMHGDAYKPNQEAFDQYQVMPQNVENMIRQSAGGLSDVFISMLVTASMDEQTFTERLTNTLEAGAKKIIQKTPVVRDAMRIKPAMSTDTPANKELWRKMDSLDAVFDYYSKWLKEPSSSSNAGAPGEMNTMGASKDGLDWALKRTGETQLPTKRFAPGQPEPTNPDFKKFAEKLWDRLKKDKPEFIDKDGKKVNVGGLGFQSAMRLYGDAGEQLRYMRKVNPGNMTKWHKHLEDKPELVEFLQNRGVNHQDHWQVMNALVKYRNTFSESMFKSIKAVEHELSEMAGQPITIEDLDPYSPLDDVRPQRVDPRLGFPMEESFPQTYETQERP
jgi:hypothetical protein